MTVTCELKFWTTHQPIFDQPIFDQPILSEKVDEEVPAANLNLTGRIFNLALAR